MDRQTCRPRTRAVEDSKLVSASAAAGAGLRVLVLVLELLTVAEISDHQGRIA